MKSKAHVNKSNALFLKLFNNYVKITLAKSEYDDKQTQFELYIRKYYSVYMMSPARVVGSPKYKIDVVDGEETIKTIRKEDEWFTKSMEVHGRKFKTYYHVDERIINIIMRMITSDILYGKGIVLHAASVIYKDKAILFCGESGVGKSTLAHAICTKYNTRAYSDDLIYVIKSGDSYRAYQLPVPERNFVPKIQRGYSIRDVFFLKRDKSSRVRRIYDRSKIHNLLLEHLWTEEKRLARDIGILNSLGNQNFTYSCLLMGAKNEVPAFVMKHIRSKQ